MQAFMAKSMPETTDCALSKEMGAGMAALGTLQPLAVSLASEQKCGVRCHQISLLRPQERDYSTY